MPEGTEHFGTKNSKKAERRFVMIKVELKDGSIFEVEQGKSVFDVANQISEGLARMATCGKVNGEVVDINKTLYELKIRNKSKVIIQIN